MFTLNADHSFPLNEMVVKERGKNLLILKNTDRRLESFTCPMFYPAGTSGWPRGMLLQSPYVSRPHVTQLELARYRISF